MLAGSEEIFSRAGSLDYQRVNRRRLPAWTHLLRMLGDEKSSRLPSLALPHFAVGR